MEKNLIISCTPVGVSVCGFEIYVVGSTVLKFLLRGVLEGLLYVGRHFWPPVTS